MSTFVLIHGSWHGAWCWDKVKPLLEKQGHTVVAPDLPGHGQDKTPIPEITLQRFVDRVGQVLDAQSEPVILVGHSMGGVVITQTAEYRPDKIKTLVYLCAFLPRNGESLLQLAQQDTETLILPNLIINEAQGYHSVKEEAIREVFYHDCRDEDVARAKSLLVPEEALAPVATPVQTSADNFGRIPRVYIECLRDQTIGLSLQKQMNTATPCQMVLSLDTGHSPFFSAPEALAAHLVTVAKKQR
ncbi:MAG: alpha/beta fold hydrolase [Ardenticatenaceae bacterium]|nr:alpha/beta fold hydrolase [Ardenticatenaceae bacterium]